MNAKLHISPQSEENFLPTQTLVHIFHKPKNVVFNHWCSRQSLALNRSTGSFFSSLEMQSMAEEDTLRN